MSELILHTIVEKLEQIEIVMLKQNTAREDDTSQQNSLQEVFALRHELKMYSGGLKKRNDTLNELLDKLDEYHKKFNGPRQNTIRHTHHLHKGLWISVALSFLCILFLALFINSSNKNAALKASDIKYRILKLSAGKNLLKVLYHLDSLYAINPEGLSGKMIWQEDSIAAQVRLKGRL